MSIAGSKTATSQRNARMGTQMTPEMPILTGTTADARWANKLAGYAETPPGYIWHHVEDMKRMQLLPKTIHNSVPHTGGRAVIRNGGFDR